MKVLIFSTYFLPVIGGVQTYVKLLAQGFSEWRGCEGERIEVTLATETPGTRADDAEFAYRVVRRPGLRELRELIGGSDVVFVAGPALLPMALCWISAKPFVIEHHGYQAICPNGLLFLQPEKTACPGYFSQRKFLRCFRCRAAEAGTMGAVRSMLLTFPRRWLSNRAAANIAVSDHVRGRVGLERSCTIYHGIEDAAPSATRRDADSLPRRGLEVAYVGRLVAEKGLPLLLQAARKLKDEGVPFHVTLIGDGPQRDELRAMMSKLEVEDRVTLAGEMRGEQLERALRGVSVVVMPSIWEETAGFAAIEHMFRGGAVIAADIGGLGEIVDGAGIKFRPHDWRALADCIRKLAENPAEAAAVGEVARRRALETFTLERMVREHVQALQAAAHSSSRA